MARTNTRLTRRQYIELFRLLSRHCQKGEDGFAVYEEGWNDKRITAELGEPFTIANVVHMRAEEFGSLQAMPSQDPTFESRLKEIEAGWAKTVEELRREIEALKTEQAILRAWASKRKDPPFRGPVAPHPAPLQTLA